ncbi:MAG: hypothetical protein ACRC41_04735 [Sarcina sp.]
MKKLYNLLVGFTITFGKCMFGLFIIAMVLDKNLINFDTTLFVLVTNLIGWAISSIYNLEISEFVSGAIHSIVLYIGCIISFYFIFGKDIFAEVFRIGTFVYFSFYGISFLAGYYYYKKLDFDLNDTVDYIKKFEDMLVKKGEKNE